jgi:DnaJ-class molecular chaperone
MTELRISEICNPCNGTGTNIRVPEGDPPITCDFCSGVGWIENDKINIDDIMDKIQDTIDKVDDVKSVVDDIWGVVENL